jgi:hypothetical protein
MGLDSLSALKPAGGTLLLLAALGFLVYDSLYCSEIDGAPGAKARAGVGFYKQIYDCGLSLAVLGGVAGVLLLVLLILYFLGVSLPKAVGLILWIIPLILFLGLLIAGSIAVDSSKYGEDPWEGREDWNYNKSDALRDYLQGYYEWIASNPVTPGSAGPTEEWTWDKIQQSTAEEYCTHEQAPGDIPQTYGTLGELEIYFDKFEFPLATNQSTVGGSHSSLESFFSGLSIFLSPRVFYTPNPVPACYDAFYDQESYKTAIDDKDLCKVKPKDGAKCAPGWTPELAVKQAVCEKFKQCIREFNFVKDSGFLAETQPFERVENQYPPGSYYYYLQFPKGWDAFDDLHTAHVKYADNLKSSLYGSDGLFSYHLANSILLGFAVVGAVLLIVGVIVEAVAGGGKVSGG